MRFHIDIISASHDFRYNSDNASSHHVKERLAPAGSNQLVATGDYALATIQSWPYPQKVIGAMRDPPLVFILTR